MLVFIDESGDAGFAVDEGASPVFVIGMVIFADDSAAVETQRAIEASDARRRHKPEFKFGKCSDALRDSFFEAVRERPFGVRAIVVRKSRVRSPAATMAGSEKFYEFFLDALVRRNADALRGAKVIIDGSGSRPFRLNLNAALRRGLPAGAVKSVRFMDSRADVLLQLADMSVGAIMRAYKPDRARADRWLNALAPRIEDIWEFP